MGAGPGYVNSLRRRSCRFVRTNCSARLSHPPPSSRSVEFRAEIGSLPARDRSSSASRSVQLTDLDAGRARGGGLWALIPRRRPASPRLVGASRTEADSLLVPIIQSAKRASVADLWRSPCRLLSDSCSRKRVPRQGQAFLWWAVSLDLSLLSSGTRQRRRRERTYYGPPWIRGAPRIVQCPFRRAARRKDSLARIKQNGILGQLLRDSWLAFTEGLL